MKKIILIITFLISGCATKQPIIEVPQIQAPNDLMEDCEPFVYPAGPTFKDFQDTIPKLKRIYEKCNIQNDGKKKFIIKVTK